MAAPLVSLGVKLIPVNNEGIVGEATFVAFVVGFGKQKPKAFDGRDAFARGVGDGPVEIRFIHRGNSSQESSRNEKAPIARTIRAIGGKGEKTSLIRQLQPVSFEPLQLGGECIAPVTEWT